ncbi:MAG: ankyrin repeat domain-containing protein [Rhodoferax sp.]|uniref:ankyrin repeat domain-containing protein n=1 Tax=Rhodoferax sp. TaxID=50421 RepID=UPI0026099F12|nr:ankyrin repeat domain-containing protein [Rhodoferax sp.]MDD2883230.1 ankyrin repeat domain-containing protein [Rhodoferax sp.]
MNEAPDTQEFRLYAATVTDIFGRGAVRDLARAAAAGKADAVAQAVRAGADPNARGKEGLTPLFWSIMANNAAGAQALLKAGANPNLPMRMNNGKGFEWDEYPVVIAAKGKPAVLKVLLDNGGDPESTSHKLSALRAAVGCLECVRMLVERGVNVNRVIEGENAGFTAVATGQFDVVIYLLERGFSVDLDKLAWHAQDLGGPANTDPRKQQIVDMIKAKGIQPFVPDWEKKK